MAGVFLDPAGEVYLAAEVLEPEFPGLRAGGQGGDVLRNAVSESLVHRFELGGAGTGALRLPVVDEGRNHVKPGRLVQYHGHDSRYLSVVPGLHLEEPLQVGVPLLELPQQEPAHVFRVERVLFMVLEHREPKRKPGIEEIFPEHPGAEAVNRPYGGGEKLPLPVPGYVSGLPVGLDISRYFPSYPGPELRRRVFGERDGDYLRNVRPRILEDAEILGYYGPRLSRARPRPHRDSLSLAQYAGLLVVQSQKFPHSLRHPCPPPPVFLTVPLFALQRSA